MVDGFLAPEQDAIGFTKGDSPLHDYLDALLTQIGTDGRWLKAYQATVGTVTHKTPTPPPVTL
jgi:hypothetical protein